jgi:hypothetical protein
MEDESNVINITTIYRILDRSPLSYWSPLKITISTSESKTHITYEINHIHEGIDYSYMNTVHDQILSPALFGLE